MTEQPADPSTTPPENPEPVNPEVQEAQRKEAQVDLDRRDAEDEAQRVRAEQEAKTAQDHLTQENRVRVALNQRVEPQPEAVFLASTGHNPVDGEEDDADA